MPLKVCVTALYGVWLGAAGIWRFAEAGSKPALGFGLTTAVMALIGAWLLHRGKRTAAHVLLIVTLLFVVGFFISKSIKEGLDLRVGITLLTSLLEVIVLLVPTRSKTG